MASKARYLAEFQQIGEENGGMIRAEDVLVFASANPHSALHGCFTWDDGEAAHQWRLNQARKLIRVMVIVVARDPERTYRAYVSLKENRYNGEGYASFVTVMSDGNLREAFVMEAYQEMQSFLGKYETIKELAGVFAEMREALKGKPAKSRKRYKRPEAQAPPPA